MRRELGQLSLADGLVEGGAGRNRQLEKIAVLVALHAASARSPPGLDGKGGSRVPLADRIPRPLAREIRRGMKAAPRIAQRVTTTPYDMMPTGQYPATH
jgi:hypothetical protein